MRRLLLIALLAAGCADPVPKSSNADPGDTGVADASISNSNTADASARLDDGEPMTGDAAGGDDMRPAPDLPSQPTYCDSVSSAGFFPDCTACDAEGLDCNTIESPSASGRACGCGGGCPCGLRCDDYAIGPNIFVNNICVR